MTIAEIRALPVADRLQLIEGIWDSLAEAPDALGLPDWHREELDRRLEAFERDPTGGRPWDEVKTDILAGLRR